MVSREEQKKIQRMLNAIKRDGAIHRWDLIDEVNISIRDYNQLKSYMEHKYDSLIQYDKSTQTWTRLGELDEIKLARQEEIENGTR